MTTIKLNAYDEDNQQHYTIEANDKDYMKAIRDYNPIMGKDVKDDYLSIMDYLSDYSPIDVDAVILPALLESGLEFTETGYDNVLTTIDELWDNPSMFNSNEFTCEKSADVSQLTISNEDGYETYLQLKTNGVLYTDNYSGNVYVYQNETPIKLDNFDHAIYFGNEALEYED